MPTDSSIEISSISPIFRWAAGLLAAIVLIVSLTAFSEKSSGKESLFILFGLIYLGFSLTLASIRYRSYIDIRQRKLITLKRFGPWSDRTETNLDQISEIAFAPREEKKDSDGVSYYVTSVIGIGPENPITLSEFSSIWEAKSFANKVSRALGILESPTIKAALPIHLAQGEVLPDLGSGNKTIPSKIMLAGIFSPFTPWKVLCSIIGGDFYRSA